MPRAIDFATLSLVDALDLAILIEDEARDRYEEFADQMDMHHTPDAARFFRDMAVNETKHGTELTERRQKLFPTEPRKVTRDMLWDVEAPGYEAARMFMTAHDAMDVALEAEVKAHDYFAAALTTTSSARRPRASSTIPARSTRAATGPGSRARCSRTSSSSSEASRTTSFRRLERRSARTRAGSRLAATSRDVLASDLDALSAYLQSNFKYDTGGYQEYGFETPARRYLAKLDYNLNDRNKVSFRYLQLDSSSDRLASSSSSLGFGRPTGTNTLFFENTNYQLLENIKSGVAEWNSILGATKANNLIIGYTTNDESRPQKGDLFPMVDILKDNLTYTTFGY